MATPRTNKQDTPGAMDVDIDNAPNVRKYQHLSSSFFRGALPGQVASIYRDKDKPDKKERIAEFIQAVVEGDKVTMDSLTPRLREQMLELGVPEDKLPTIEAAAPRAAAGPLSPMFFKGKLPGQIASVYRDKANEAKVAAFQAAVQDGRVKLDADQLTPGLIAKLLELKVDVPQAIADAVQARQPARPKTDAGSDVAAE